MQVQVAAKQGFRKCPRLERRLVVVEQEQGDHRVRFTVALPKGGDSVDGNRQRDHFGEFIADTKLEVEAPVTIFVHTKSDSGGGTLDGYEGKLVLSGQDAPKSHGLLEFVLVVAKQWHGVTSDQAGDEEGYKA